MYRRTPVPNTGQGNHLRKFLRFPKTTAEKRWNLCHIKEGIKIRRRRLYTPTCLDDIWRRPERSWKKFRKNQWKKINQEVKEE